MVATRPLVVVAGAEPSVTDDVAERLRETCVVRTAYGTGEVLDRLDTDVDVVLVAPGLGTGAVERVRRAVRERGLPSRLGRLDEAADDAGESGLPSVDPSGTDPALRADVERLATLSQYRTALDEYFTLARRSAGDDDTGGGNLEDQLEYVRDRLDDTAGDLDSSSLFEAALRDPEPTGERDERSGDRPDGRPDGGVTIGDDGVDSVDGEGFFSCSDCEASSGHPSE